MEDLVPNVRRTRARVVAGYAASTESGLPVDHATFMPAALDCWAATDGRHRLVLGRQGQVAVCGTRTRQFLAKSRDFRICAGRLLLSDPRHAGRFQRLHAGVWAEIRTEIFPMKDNDGHWICRAGGIESGNGQPLIGLTIQQATQDHAAEWVDLRGVFDLTDSEDMILREFLYGQTPHAIAEQHQLSINTVRTHFRHIYDKMDVGNNHELRRKLLGYRLR